MALWKEKKGRGQKNTTCAREACLKKISFKGNGFSWEPPVTIKQILEHKAPDFLLIIKTCWTSQEVEPKEKSSLSTFDNSPISITLQKSVHRIRDTKNLFYTTLQKISDPNMGA